MGALIFLVLAVVVRRRRVRLCSGTSTAPPTTFDSGIEAFRREMDALAAREDDDQDPRDGAA